MTDLDEEQDAYPDDLYDMYSSSRRSQGQRSRSQANRVTYIEEGEDNYPDDDLLDDPEFEMLNARRSGGRPSAQRSPVDNRASSRSRRPPPQEQPQIRKIRVKVHADDTRYVMVGTAIEFRDFVDQIRIKFGLRTNFKVKIKDEGDMITMSDQDDLDMAVQASKAAAKKSREEMGKMEVSHVFLAFSHGTRAGVIEKGC